MSFQILVLEDNLEVLELILRVIKAADPDAFPTIISEAKKIKAINESDWKFDLILLDRNCRDGANFHELNLTKFNAKQVIGISSLRYHNQELENKGVVHFVKKDYGNLGDFANQLRTEMEIVLHKLP